MGTGASRTLVAQSDGELSAAATACESPGSNETNGSILQNGKPLHNNERRNNDQVEATRGPGLLPPRRITHPLDDDTDDSGVGDDGESCNRRTAAMEAAASTRTIGSTKKERRHCKNIVTQRQELQLPIVPFTAFRKSNRRFDDDDDDDDDENNELDERVLLVAGANALRTESKEGVTHNKNQWKRTSKQELLVDSSSSSSLRREMKLDDDYNHDSGATVRRGGQPITTATTATNYNSKPSKTERNSTKNKSEEKRSSKSASNNMNMNNYNAEHGENVQVPQSGQKHASTTKETTSVLLATPTAYSRTPPEPESSELTQQQETQRQEQHKQQQPLSNMEGNNKAGVTITTKEGGLIRQESISSGLENMETQRRLPVAHEWKNPQSSRTNINSVRCPIEPKLPYFTKQRVSRRYYEKTSYTTSTTNSATNNNGICANGGVTEQGNFAYTGQRWHQQRQGRHCQEQQQQQRRPFPDVLLGGEAIKRLPVGFCLYTCHTCRHRMICRDGTVALRCRLCRSVLLPD